MNKYSYVAFGIIIAMFLSVIPMTTESVNATTIQFNDGGNDFEFPLINETGTYYSNNTMYLTPSNTVDFLYIYTSFYTDYNFTNGLTIGTKIRSSNETEFSIVWAIDNVITINDIHDDRTYEIQMLLDFYSLNELPPNNYLFNWYFELTDNLSPNYSNTKAVSDTVSGTAQITVLEAPSMLLSYTPSPFTEVFFNVQYSETNVMSYSQLVIENNGNVAITQIEFTVLSAYWDYEFTVESNTEFSWNVQYYIVGQSWTPLTVGLHPLDTPILPSGTRTVEFRIGSVNPLDDYGMYYAYASLKPVDSSLNKGTSQTAYFQMDYYSEQFEYDISYTGGYSHIHFANMIAGTSNIVSQNWCHLIPVTGNGYTATSFIFAISSDFTSSVFKLAGNGNLILSYDGISSAGSYPISSLGTTSSIPLTSGEFYFKLQITEIPPTTPATTYSLSFNVIIYSNPVIVLEGYAGLFDKALFYGVTWHSTNNYEPPALTDDDLTVFPQALPELEITANRTMWNMYGFGFTDGEPSLYIDNMVMDEEYFNLTAYFYMIFTSLEYWVDYIPFPESGQVPFSYQNYSLMFDNFYNGNGFDEYDSSIDDFLTSTYVGFYTYMSIEDGANTYEYENEWTLEPNGEYQTIPVTISLSKTELADITQSEWNWESLDIWVETHMFFYYETLYGEELEEDYPYIIPFERMDEGLETLYSLPVDNLHWNYATINRIDVSEWVNKSSIIPEPEPEIPSIWDWINQYKGSFSFSMFQFFVLVLSAIASLLLILKLTRKKRGILSIFIIVAIGMIMLITLSPIAEPVSAETVVVNVVDDYGYPLSDMTVVLKNDEYTLPLIEYSDENQTYYYSDVLTEEHTEQEYDIFINGTDTNENIYISDEYTSSTVVYEFEEQPFYKEEGFMFTVLIIAISGIAVVLLLTKTSIGKNLLPVLLIAGLMLLFVADTVTYEVEAVDTLGSVPSVETIDLGVGSIFPSDLGTRIGKSGTVLTIPISVKCVSVKTTTSSGYKVTVTPEITLGQISSEEVNQGKYNDRVGTFYTLDQHEQDNFWVDGVLFKSILSQQDISIASLFSNPTDNTFKVWITGDNTDTLSSYESTDVVISFITEATGFLGMGTENHQTIQHLRVFMDTTKSTSVTTNYRMNIYIPFKTSWRGGYLNYGLRGQALKWIYNWKNIDVVTKYWFRFELFGKTYNFIAVTSSINIPDKVISTVQELILALPQREYTKMYV